MWKTLSAWLFTVFSMGRELQEHREGIRQLQERLRNLEEAIKLLAQEQRHGREIDSSERENMLLRLQQEISRMKELQSPRGKKIR